MRVCVLGAAEAHLGDSAVGSLVDVGSPKQRALLAGLALHRGRAVSADQLVDLLWGGAPPPGAANTLQGYVAGLRRALEPDRAPRSPARVLVTEPPGYALHLPDGALDVDHFEATVGRVHRMLAAHTPLPAAAPSSAPAGPAGPAEDLAELATADLDTALALWRGTPYLELEDAPAAVAERVRLEELRMVALEDRAVAGLALGRHATVAAELEALTLQHPLRERLWALRAVALTRSGRQADALDVLAQVRAVLADELGLEPGPELRALQSAVLRQDPALEWVPVPREPHPAERTDPPVPAETTPVTTVGSWPLVGRDEELAALVGLLDRADQGVPGFAALVGDPGIGKSRLLAEVAAAARARSATVLVGRCSQDEGAPPLWPWAGVLDGLGRSLPTEEGDADESARFRAWDDIVREVQEVARRRTVLVLLDDLHWADASTLRVLGLLLESVHEGRIVLVATWRADPPPTGALGAVAEQLSRRHGLRLHLQGLGSTDVTEIVGAVADSRPSQEQADALRERTDGNPFFVLEYARLAGHDGGDLAALLAEPTPPHGVADVVARRLERLPEAARSVLVPAAVLGRHFDLETLAAVSGSDEDDVLDALDVAGAAGLVREAGAGRFRFAHALVRDTVYATTSPTRRARWHVKAAEVLEKQPGREGEVARHWHGAGPGHAARAWRADRAAAREAVRLHAYEEGVEFLTAGLVALAEDPEATPLDEYDVLTDLALADKATGDWINLRPVVHRLIAVADQMDDAEALARASVHTSTDALWQSAHHGEVDEVVVAALRRALERLPAADNELRCRTMLALAGELYYGVSAQERDALAEEAVAMARRLGDPALLRSACQNAFVCIWRPATARRREELAQEAVEIAQRLGDARALTYARTVRAVVAAELGDLDLAEHLVATVRPVAEEQRNLYALVVLASLEIPWCAMRGEFEKAGELLTHLQAVGERMGLAQQSDAVRGGFLAILIWQQEYAGVLAVLQEAGDDEALPLDASVLSLLTRLGRLDEAREFLDGREIDFGGDTWFSLLPWALAADAALPLGDRELGATAYALLAPHAGHMASAGSGVALGPVDAYLAMAAAATGETEIAARHADTALELCQAWRLPLVGEWIADQRERFGF